MKLSRTSSLTLSAGTPGEGWGEGRRRSRARTSRCEILEAGPHPNPLPEYREREQDKGRTLARFALLGALALACVVPNAFAQVKPAAKTNKDGLALNPSQVRGDEITPAQEAAVAKGLAWLASAQQRDGAYG